MLSTVTFSHGCLEENWLQRTKLYFKKKQQKKQMFIQGNKELYPTASGLKNEAQIQNSYI